MVTRPPTMQLLRDRSKAGAGSPKNAKLCHSTLQKRRHMIGDVFSALIGVGLSTGAALGHLQALIDASIGAPHLAIVDDVSAWRDAAPVPYKKI